MHVVACAMPAHDADCRKSLLVLTDGEENASSEDDKRRCRELMAEMQRGGLKSAILAMASPSECPSLERLSTELATRVDFVPRANLTFSDMFDSLFGLLMYLLQRQP